MGGSKIRHPAGWTEDRVGALKKLWLEGQSASGIAKQLGGGVTRSAVISKIHRLGLSGRTAPSSPAHRSYRPKKPNHKPATQTTRSQSGVTKEPVTIAAVPPEPKADDQPGTAILATLSTHMCKWPIGDPLHNEFSFCGRRAEGRGVYCVEHAKVAYQSHSSRAGETRTPDWMYL